MAKLFLLSRVVIARRGFGGRLSGSRKFVKGELPGGFG